jgi:hypothetical protein
MRPFIGLILALLLIPGLSFADPASWGGGTGDQTASALRIQVGAAQHWSPARFRDRLALGLGWSIPRRLYDADGQLLTERSLLFRGRDLERTGLYLALRF